MCPLVMFHVRCFVSFLAGASFWFALMASASGSPLLPDIQLEIHDVQQTTSSGIKVVRFSTWTINMGSGVLELHQHSTQNPDGTYDVDQWIYDSNGTHTVNLCGQFAMISGRLRFTDSADYFLKEVTQGNGVGAVVAANQKVAYCIIDS